MDKSMAKGVVIGGIAMVVLTGGAVTGYKAMNQAKYADVVHVKEVTQNVTTPRQDCKDVQVQKQAPVKTSIVSPARSSAASRAGCSATRSAAAPARRSPPWPGPRAAPTPATRSRRTCRKRTR